MATQQSASDSKARPANDGNRDPHGKQPEGLENQNVTRPSPPPPNTSGERDRQHEGSGLEDRNVTRPDPVR